MWQSTLQLPHLLGVILLLTNIGQDAIGHPSSGEASRQPSYNCPLYLKGKIQGPWFSEKQLSSFLETEIRSMVTSNVLLFVLALNHTIRTLVIALVPLLFLSISFAWTPLFSRVIPQAIIKGDIIILKWYFALCHGW